MGVFFDICRCMCQSCLAFRAVHALLLLNHVTQRLVPASQSASGISIYRLSSPSAYLLLFPEGRLVGWGAGPTDSAAARVNVGGGGSTDKRDQGQAITLALSVPLPASPLSQRPVTPVRSEGVT